MNDTKKQLAEDESIIQAALHWNQRVDQGMDAEEQESFMAWMKADKRHGIAYRTQAKTGTNFDEQIDWQLNDNSEAKPGRPAPLEKRFRRHLPVVAVIAAVLLTAVGVLFF